MLPFKVCFIAKLNFHVVRSKYQFSEIKSVTQVIQLQFLPACLIIQFAKGIALQQVV